MNAKKICPVCKSDNIRYHFSYKNTARKKGRKWYLCYSCLTFTGEDIKTKSLYEEKYYPSIEHIKQRFNYVNSLPSYKSNNYYRVQRLKRFIKKYEKQGLLKSRKKRVLDVGCGFGIFLYKFLESAKLWEGIGLDLDPKLKNFLKSIGIKMVVSKDISRLKSKFDLISFNRVLEHVKNPLTLLKKARSALKKGGVIYLEVPDILSYSLQGKKSEAFTDDHYFALSPKSLAILAEKADLKFLNLSRIREVNDKLTIYAFLAKG